MPSVLAIIQTVVKGKVLLGDNYCTKKITTRKKKMKKERARSTQNWGFLLFLIRERVGWSSLSLIVKEQKLLTLSRPYHEGVFNCHFPASWLGEVLVVWWCISRISLISGWRIFAFGQFLCVFFQFNCIFFHYKAITPIRASKLTFQVLFS